jgi:hypothetical protein
VSRSTLETKISPEELRSYAEGLVVEALRDGTIAPAVLLECLYYALDPELLSATRAFAGLAPDERLMIMSYAKRLSEGEVLQSSPQCDQP